MKLKHILLLSVFILISGTIFYFGWIQIKLPENTYGIAFTKSSGYLDKIYEPGKFSWDFRKLIPTNFKLLKFKLSAQQLEINEQRELPFGDIYSEYLPGSPDFSYHIEYYLTYSIKPETFPSMVAELRLDPDQMHLRYKTINADIQLFIGEYYKNKSLESNNTIKLFDNNNEISSELLSALFKNFPSLDFKEFIPVEISIPDTTLYNKAKEIYLSSLELENKVISESRIKIAEQEIRDTANFETLKKYGELLNEYPSLIDFFSVIEINCDSIIPKLNLEIPSQIEKQN